jgi:hypothetical protein
VTDYTSRDLPKPGWELLDRSETKDGAKQVYHVKLAQPHIARLLANQKFVEVEYVHVNVTHKNITDASGSFIFNETAITASDEAGALFESYLFYAHRALTLEESLFSIGEV